MSERRGTKGLELWCRRMTEGYPGVNVVNMTTSWRDGLAFCAIIHHFRPDLIEFSKLNKDDIFHNNELAFRVAERHLGIPALLEPEDMVEFPVPDRLSILTYLSQFYQTFVVGQGKSPARIAQKRPATTPEHSLVSPTSSSPPSKVTFPTSGKVRREPCAKCGLPVFIAERLNVGKLLYHRTCFRCARCNSQLTLANYYETESNEFCCETCPGEEKSMIFNEPNSSVLTKSLSDEEKSASLKNNQEADEYSSKFETALEFPEDEGLKRNSTLNSSQYSKARSFFINSQVDDLKCSNSSESSNEDEAPDLPKTKPPVRDENLTFKESFSDSGFPKDNNTVNVNIQSSVSLSSASAKLEKSHDIVTKDTISAEGNTNSLVKARMRLFETKSDASNETHSVNNKVPVRNSTSANIEVGRNNNEDSSLHSSKDNILNNSEEKQKEIIVKEVSKESNDSAITVSDSETSPLKTPDVITITDSETSSLPEEKTDDSIIIISDSTETELSIKGIKNETETEAIKLELPEQRDESTLQNEKIKFEETPPEKPEPEAEPEPEPQAATIPQQPVPSKIEDDDYPGDLNPFGDESADPPEQPKKTETKASLNPFEDEEDDIPTEITTPQPATRRVIKPSTIDRKVSDESFQKPEPAKRKISAPKISLNPFWSEDEESDESSKPVPKPRFSKYSPSAPEPKPRESGLSINSSTTFGSSSSVQSVLTLKKKKPAPKPPSMLGGTESGPSSLTSSPCHSVTQSPRATPKMRKNKKAPPPPTSTPREELSIAPDVDFTIDDDFEKEKFVKDEQNRNRQSQNLSIQSPSSSENSSSLAAPNKSTYGKWKRKKGQAPARPVLQKRIIKQLPMIEVKRELEVIEIQQQGLEKQGVRLEQIIREKCEGPGDNPDDCLPPEIEDMILQLFELVNEKNELFRKQAELMYLRRQHKLEEEHADIEYQIRCLMAQPEANKTDSDKAREEELINRLVEVVERRNEIIECLEMDRVREAEEDDSINNHLNLFTLKKEEDKSAEKNSSKKEKKKHKKEKKLKLKGHKVDADKDIDESESSTSSIKDKKKKKFNIF